LTTTHTHTHIPQMDTTKNNTTSLHYRCVGDKKTNSGELITSFTKVQKVRHTD